MLQIPCFLTGFPSCPVLSRQNPVIVQTLLPIHTIQYVCDSFAFTFAMYFPSYCCLSKFICLCHISSLMFLSIPTLMFSFSPISPPILPLISPYISPPLIFSPVSPLTCIFLFFAHFSSFYSTYFSSYFSLYFSSYFSSYFFLLTLLVLFICEPVFKGSVSRDFRPPVFS